MNSLLVWGSGGAAAVFVALLGLLLLLNSRKPKANGTVEKVAKAENGEASKPSPDDAAAIERAKTAVHGILRGLASHLEKLTSDSNRFDTSLLEHQNAVQKAMTIASIRELERVMVEQLETMRSSNERYRSELAEAHSVIREQEQELEKLQSDAGLDFLTDLPNRRAFDKRLEEFLDMSRRYGKPFSLVVIDVDFFKVINDDFGHLAGDRILRAIAKVMGEQMRASDFIARYGGEEFAVILPETSLSQAKSLAEKLRVKVERSVFRFEGTPINVTISAGVGEVAISGDSPERLFGRADAALYRAKQGGRNRVDVSEVPAAPVDSP